MDKKKLAILCFCAIIVVAIYFISKGLYATTEGDSELVSINETISIECDKTKISPNEIVKCTIKGVNFNTQVSSISAKLNLGDNLSFSSIEKDSSWEGVTDENGFDLYTANNKTGNFDFVTFNLKADSINSGVNSKIALKNMIISDENFDEYTLNDVNLDVRIASNIATLSNLTVTGSEFSFSPSTTVYNLELDADEVTIGATATNSNAEIDGVGKKNNWSLEKMYLILM